MCGKYAYAKELNIILYIKSSLFKFKKCLKSSHLTL